MVAVETEKAVYQLDGGLSPGFFNLHEKGSLGKILNSELPPMHICKCVNVGLEYFLLLLSTAPFMGCHSPSSAFISPYLYHPLLSP